MTVPYVPQSWENLPNQTTPITAARLTHMEDGIAAALIASSPASEEEYGVVEPWDSGTDYSAPGSLCTSDGFLWVSVAGATEAEAPTSANFGMYEWLPVDGLTTTMQNIQTAGSAARAASDVAALTTDGEPNVQGYYVVDFDQALAYEPGDIVRSSFDNGWWVAIAYIPEGTGAYPGVGPPDLGGGVGWGFQWKRYKMHGLPIPVNDAIEWYGSIEPYDEARAYDISNVVLSDGAYFFNVFFTPAGGPAPTVSDPGEWMPLAGYELQYHILDIGGSMSGFFGMGAWTYMPWWRTGLAWTKGQACLWSYQDTNGTIPGRYFWYRALVDIDAGSPESGYNPTDAGHPGYWEQFYFTSSLDGLVDVAAPGNTAAGRVLGTTATGTWGSVEFIRRGAGTPEGAVTAAVGSMYLRSDGGANTTLYIKESGAGNTGWVAK